MPFSSDNSPLVAGAGFAGSEPLSRRWALARDIAALLLGLASILTLLALISAQRQFTPESNWIGTVGYAVADKLFFVFGHYIAFALPIMVGLCALHGLRSASQSVGPGRAWLRGLGGLLILITTCALLALSVNPQLPNHAIRSFELGGLVGNLLVSEAGLNLVQPIGRVGAVLLFGTCSLIGLILFTEKLLRDLAGSFFCVFRRLYDWLGESGWFEWLGALLPSNLAGMLARCFRFAGRIHVFSRLGHWLDDLSFRRPIPEHILRDGGLGAGSILELTPRENAAGEDYDDDPEAGPAAEAAAMADATADDERPALLRRGLGLFGSRDRERSSHVLGHGGVLNRTGSRFLTPEAPEKGQSAAGDAGEAEQDYRDEDDEAHQPEEDYDGDPGAEPAADEAPEEDAAEAGQLDLLGGFSPEQTAKLQRQTAPRPVKPRRTTPEQAEMNLFPQEYHLPGLNLLSDPPSTMYEMSEEEQLRLSQRIEQTLAQFKVEVQVVEVVQGPVITRFALKVAPGVRVNKILALENELAMALKAQHVRILAPIPGQAAVGIEVPNKRANPVLLKELLASQSFQTSKSALSFALGKNISGEAVVCDLAQMPHLLIAGATGSGKSVCLNSIIASLLYRNKPDKVKFVMVDPKRVELSIYQAIPHLIAPVVSESKKAAAALAWCVEQMEQRYKLLAEIGVRNLDGYNALLNDKVPSKKIIGRELKFLPHIVIIIDELADLMMVAKNEIEEYIIRLAQMARAVGMHLVLATQRPSVNVITGIIKANFPSRIAFQVSSKVDSRTILDINGAEALMGKGDMLYSPGGAKPFRIQGCFVSDAEVERLADYIRGQEKARYEKEDFEVRPTPAERAKANMKMDELAEVGSDLDDAQLHPLLRSRPSEAGDDDEDLLPEMASGGRAGMAPLLPADMDSLSDEMLFNMALRLVLESRKGSVSYIQRRMKIGYARAGRIMDLMEERGIVGPYQGSKPRDLLVDPREYLAREFKHEA